MTFILHRTSTEQILYKIMNTGSFVRPLIKTYGISKKISCSNTASNYHLGQAMLQNCSLFLSRGACAPCVLSHVNEFACAKACRKPCSALSAIVVSD
jgi:hypothetical protein